eukprot:TRINITY_DN8880_c0_g1_i1.p1 TRINITY_DN8880_c0_g1~~TRINITY_DN8880_c0_g1_i1.p1  ORF type:complete len:279 (+),score=36.98 TRINITY_DN8880_c0_g1_i1:52-888(+)
MIIKEYRICLPFTPEEYQKGLLYVVAKASSEESISGVPMQVVYNGPYESKEFGKGIMTHRIIHIENRLPEWARKLLIRSGNVIHIEEKSYNFFPYIKTVYTCPLFSEEKFEIVVETRHAEDNGTTENIHDLPQSVLKKRIVDPIDISADKIETRYSKREEDPQYFKSKRTGRGPLKKNWQYSTKPIMCAYKLVTVNFNYWGLRHKVEKLIHEVIRSIYLSTHRQCFCWMDEWYDLSLEQIRAMETSVDESLNKHSASLSKKDEGGLLDHAKRTLKSKL